MTMEETATDFEFDSEAPILLVDDGLMDSTIAMRVYEKSRLSNPLVVLRSGDELLRYLDRVVRNEKPAPALVFLDVHMEGKSGVETLSEVRRRGDYHPPPRIIMLTNEDDPEIADISRKTGADGYKVKPAAPAEFVRFFNSFEPEPG